MRILAITGASGYLGQGLVRRLAGEKVFDRIVGLDIRPPASTEGMTFVSMDIRCPGLEQVFRTESVTDVVHLAFVVNPTRSPALEHDIDVGGTRNLLRASAAAGVRRLVAASSIAAYGWHADNPLPIPESHPVRGNSEFFYARNKAIVEDLLRQFADTHPACRTIILRICNVLGPHVRNAISAGIEAPLILGIHQRDPFLAFTHEDDMSEVLYLSLMKPLNGPYNVAGEGMIRLSEMASIAGRRLVRLPEFFVRSILDVAFFLRLSPFGGRQIGFVKHSCVPDISKLKNELGYTPRFSSRETFRAFVEQRILTR